MDTDVLIIGAGPTGLMLATQLARRGIRVLIADRHGEPAQQTRAMGVQARTLEIYAKLGIAEEAVSQGAITRGVNLWANARHKARVPVSDAGKGLSAFPFVLMLGQDDNERILGARLNQSGVTVQWSTELVRLEQHASHATATLRDASGHEREVSAAWVAGCDGSRSTVRELCGIAFPGAPYEHVFFVADTVATGDMVPGELNAYLWRRGFHLFFPMRGKHGWRVIGILPAHQRDQPDLDFDDLIPHLRREVGAGLQFQACHWFSTYRIQHRCAERFRDRRCFLLGDAAHIHSPMGAQGMNTGLQDAYNLAWKLAMVMQGQANEALLDSYQIERRRVAQALLRGTDRAFGLVVSDSLLAAFFRTRIMGNLARMAMRFERVQRLAYRTISQIGIRYRTSPLSLPRTQSSEHAPQAGDRFPWLSLQFTVGGVREDLYARLDDTRFNLVVIGEQAPAEARHPLLRTLFIPFVPQNEAVLASAGLRAPSVYLLRPDTHIAMSGDRLDMHAVEAYLSGICMVPERDAGLLDSACTGCGVP